MAENLLIALRLTAIGMGVTFTAIGVLVLGMYAMTLLLKDHPEEEDESVPLFVREEEEELRRCAAAVAVAVALARESQIMPIRRTPYGVWGLESRLMPLIWRTQRRAGMRKKC